MWCGGVASKHPFIGTHDTSDLFPFVLCSAGEQCLQHRVISSGKVTDQRVKLNVIALTISLESGNESIEVSVNGTAREEERDEEDHHAGNVRKRCGGLPHPDGEQEQGADSKERAPTAKSVGALGGEVELARDGAVSFEPWLFMVRLRHRSRQLVEGVIFDWLAAVRCDARSVSML